MSHLLTHQFTRLTDAVDRWAVDSQQTARRNAMIASNALARVRAERDDVEAFLDALDRPRESGVRAPGAAHA
jgi:hypothetical protein